MKKVRLTDRGKRVFFQVLCGVLGAALAVLGALWGQERQQRQTLEAERLDGMKRSCYDLEGDLRDMETALSKLGAAGSKKQSALLLGELWRLSGSAASSLSLLPAAHGDSYRLNQFLLRAGDYAHELLRGLLSGRALTDRDMEQLTSLRSQCAAESERLVQTIASGSYPQAALEEGGYYGETEEARENLPDYPTLIYDGPFSQSSENRDPRGLTDSRIGEEEARSAARALFPEGELQYSGYVAGPMATYEYTLAGEDGGETTLSLTERGGKLLCFMSPVTGQKQDPPSQEESRSLHGRAQAYLRQMGFGDMEPSYAQYYAGVVVLNYAVRQEEVILYSDLIKVYVDRDTGEVCGMDARNYYANHRERTLSLPQLTREQAQERLNTAIQVEKISLALIPLTGETEVLCYECKGTLGEDFYIVYINAITGEEEQIFQVIDSENGDLVV